MTLDKTERRREELEANERIGYLIKENQVLNARIEHLEKLGSEFEVLKIDLKWTLRISKVIVAIIVFITGDEIKRKAGF